MRSHEEIVYRWCVLHKIVRDIHMGCLRLAGSLKVQVSFAEYGLFYRALLQKRPILVRSLLLVATAYLSLEGAMNNRYRCPLNNV